jgi:hypothetical protein
LVPIDILAPVDINTCADDGLPVIPEQNFANQHEVSEGESAYVDLTESTAER